jgi:tripartite-type tricarboxylate transporter receptor subunit TctC
LFAITLLHENTRKYGLTASKSSQTSIFGLSARSVTSSHPRLTAWLGQLQAWFDEREHAAPRAAPPESAFRWRDWLAVPWLFWEALARRQPCRTSEHAASDETTERLFRMNEHLSSPTGPSKAAHQLAPGNPVFGRFHRYFLWRRCMTAMWRQLKGSSLTIAMVWVIGSTVPARASDFYQGRQIRLVVSTEASGAYDTYGRLVSQYLADHIPGHPTVFVQNMGGSGGLQAANYLANGAPKDGTVIGAVEANIPTASLFLPENAKFNVNDFAWIGSLTNDPFIGYAWGASKLQTYEDAKSVQFIMGAPTARSYSAQMAQVSNVLFGTKFKIVIGYSGSNEVKLAMERGEVDGTFGNSWSSLKADEPSWISDHKIRIITQFGLERHPDLRDVPMFLDQAKSDDDRQLLELLGSQQEFAKPYLAPPGIPADRLAILRQAFDAMLKDPKFLAAVKKVNLDIFHPLSGEDLAAKVAKVSRTSPAVVKRAKDILDHLQSDQKP